MRFIRSKKFIVAIGIIVMGFGFFQQPKTSDAFFADWVNAAIQVIGHGIQGVLLGIDSVANTISASLQTVREIVNGLPIMYGPARQVLSGVTAGCDLLGGDLSALSTFSELTSSGDGTDDINFEELDDRLIIPDEYQTGSGGSGNGDVAGDSTTVASNQTAAHETIHLPDRGTLATNNEKLSTSLMTIGDQTKANLTLYITKKLGILKYRQVCYKTLQQSMQQSMLVASWNEQLKQAFVDTLVEIEPRMNSINSHVGSLEQQLNKAKQDIFKAIATSVAIDVNEQNTTDAIANVKPQLTVQNYEQLTDALAKQVNAPAMIKKNYDGDKNKQLIMTTLLNAEIAVDGVTKQQAMETFEGLVKAELYEKCYQSYQLDNWNDTEIFAKVSDVMSPECDVNKVMNSYKEEFKALMSLARESAAIEVNNGAGFLSTRTCVDTTDADKSKITLAAEAAQKYLSALQTQQNYENPHEQMHSNYVTAINDAKKAAAEAKAVASKVDGGIVEPCGSIIDAGSFSKTVMDNYVHEMIHQQVDIKQENLPLYSKTAETLASKLFGGVILNPSKTSNVLTSTGKSFLEAIFTGSYSSSRTGPTNSTIKVNNNNATVVTGSTSSGESPSSGRGSVGGRATLVPVIPYASPRGGYGGAY